MDLENLIKSRRTIHDYSEKQVDEALVTKALELSLFAPNHKLTFPWRYYSLKSQARAHFEEGMIEYKSSRSSEPFSDTKRMALKKKLSAASHLILLSKLKNENEVLSQEDYATVACSVQILSMYLWDQGVGTKWSSGAFTKSSQAAEICNIDFQKEDLLGVVWVGYPSRVPDLKERPSLESLFIEVHS